MTQTISKNTVITVILSVLFLFSGAYLLHAADYAMPAPTGSPAMPAVSPSSQPASSPAPASPAMNMNSNPMMPGSDMPLSPATPAVVPSSAPESPAPAVNNPENTGSEAEAFKADDPAAATAAIEKGIQEIETRVEKLKEKKKKMEDERAALIQKYGADALAANAAKDYLSQDNALASAYARIEKLGMNITTIETSIKDATTIKEGMQADLAKMNSPEAFGKQAMYITSLKMKLVEARRKLLEGEKLE